MSAKDDDGGWTVDIMGELRGTKVKDTQGKGHVNKSHPKHIAASQLPARSSLLRMLPRGLRLCQTY